MVAFRKQGKQLKPCKAMAARIFGYGSQKMYVAKAAQIKPEPFYTRPGRIIRVKTEVGAGDLQHLKTRWNHRRFSVNWGFFSTSGMESKHQGRWLPDDIDAQELAKSDAMVASKRGLGADNAKTTRDGVWMGTGGAIRARAAIGAKCANPLPVFRESERKGKLVGSKCPQGYIASHHVWGGSQFVFTRQYVPKDSSQITPGKTKGAPSFTGIF